MSEAVSVSVGRVALHFGVGGQFDVAFDGHLDGVGLPPVAAAAAVGAGDVHVGEELHVQGDLPRASQVGQRKDPVL